MLSDVVGNPLDVIASGPAVPDTSTFADAYAILERYGVVERIPPPIVAHLRSGIAGTVAETPKPGDELFAHVQNLIVGSNILAADAALAAAQAEGFHTLLLTSYLQGEAREVGRAMAAVAREIAASGRPLPRPACLVAGGETTVTLRGDGMGGRNQELALAAVADLSWARGSAAGDAGDRRRRRADRRRRRSGHRHDARPGQAARARPTRAPGAQRPPIASSRRWAICCGPARPRPTSTTWCLCSRYDALCSEALNRQGLCSSCSTLVFACGSEEVDVLSVVHFRP